MDNNQKTQVNILLIGLGYWARSEAHLPAILSALQCMQNVRLCVCVDLESAKTKILDKLKETAFEEIEKMQEKIELVWLHDKNKFADHQKILENRVEKYGINAVIISTREHQHYLNWALNYTKEKLNVLVDKPFTTRSNLTSNKEIASKLLNDIDKLVSPSYLESRVFILGCQKRYQTPYLNLLQKIGEVHKHTRYPITHIYAETADGLWWLPGERAQLRDDYEDNTGYTPGKLNDSGYHMIDIATWLLRHTWFKPLRAKVTTRMFKGSDSQALVNQLKKDNPDNTIIRYIASEMGTDRLQKEKDMDIAESIQVDFENLNASNVVCQFQFRFEHDFASKRKLPVGPNRMFPEELPPPLVVLDKDARERRDKELIRQRNKREYLLIKQGPFAFYEFRRVAKMGTIIPDTDFGGKNHLEIRYFINPDLASVIGCPSIGTLEGIIKTEQSARATVQKEDQYPTLEFIEAVGSNRTTSKLVSSVDDHDWQLRIYAAAYESGAQDGTPVETCNLEGTPFETDEIEKSPANETIEGVKRLTEMFTKTNAEE